MRQPGFLRGALSRPADRAIFAGIVAAGFAVCAFGQTVRAPVVEAAGRFEQSGVLHAIAAQPVNMPPPEHVVTAFVLTPRALTPQQLANSQVSTDKNYPSWATRRARAPAASPFAVPVPGTEVVPRPLASPTSSASRIARLREELIPLEPWSFGLAVRMVPEPAIALGESIVWVTGNWFMARSTDGGASWQYADPYADFPTFTSDQDIVFDPHRRLFLWYRQGGLVPGLQENSARLNVSRDGGTSWCGYTLRPTDVNPAWTDLDFDFPHLALTNDYLYITTTLLVTGAGFGSPHMLLLRLPLDHLQACSGFPFICWASNEGWSWAPVDSGATTVMYLGDTLDSGGSNPTGLFRVYVQPEFSTALLYVDRAVPAWTFTDRTGLCPVLGGGNPCTRTDQRITSGWVRPHDGRGEVGFLWNVRDGGGFPYPYIDGVTFDQATLEVTGRPMLWDSACAWQYGAGAPNAGALAVAAFYFCPSQPPAHAVGFQEARNGPAPGWRMFYTRIGDVPTSTVIWGDYIRVRAAGAGFVATGYTIGQDGAQPFLVPFGRASLR